MNGNFNVYVSACQGFDPKINGVVGFYNDIKVNENRMDLCVFTGINYVGSEKTVEFKLDYFLKCIEDFDNSGKDGKRIPLFAISGNANAEKEIDENYMTHSSMVTQGRNMSIPCSGLFEIQVYILEKDMNMEDNPMDRYREYQKRKKLPVSAFRFTITRI